MGLVLYDNPASSNALKVRFVLAELGLDYERVNVPFASPRPEWFTRHHPFGRIPLLEDGEVRVGESNTILRYLAQICGRSDLYPEIPAARAAVDWALDTWSMHVRPVFSPLERAVIFNLDPERGGGTLETADRQALDAALPAVAAPLDAFERFVADNGTVVGTFTIADCAVGPVLWRSRRLPLELDRWPKLARLRETISANSSFMAAEPVA